MSERERKCVCKIDRERENRKRERESARERAHTYASVRVEREITVGIKPLPTDMYQRDDISRNSPVRMPHPFLPRNLSCEM